MEVGEPIIVTRAGVGGAAMGVSLGPEASHVTCTVLPHGVQVIGSGKRLVLACDDNSLLSWKYSETDISKGNVQKTDDAIKFLLTEPSFDGVVIVSTQGRIRAFGSDLKEELCSTSLSLPKGKGSNIIHAEIMALEDQPGAAFVLLVVSASGQGKAVLHRTHLTCGDKDKWTVSKVHTQDMLSTSGDASVACCALHSSTRTLSVVWSTGEWQRFKLGGTSASGAVQEGDGEINGFLLSAEGGGGVVAAGLGGDYLMLAGRPGGKRAFNVVGVWDTLYGTEQARTEVRWDGNDDGSAEYASQRVVQAAVSVGAAFAVVVLERCVLSLALALAPMTLDLAMGKAPALTGSSPEGALPPSLRPVDLAALLADEGFDVDAKKKKGGKLEEEGVDEVGAQGLQSISRAVQEGNRREKTVLAALKAQTTTEGVSKVVCGYVEELQAEAEAREAVESVDRRQRGMRRALVSQPVVRWVVDKATQSDAKGGLDPAVIALVKAGSVSARTETGLVAYAVEKDNLLLLEAMLTHASDLPESDMVRALRHVLVTCSQSAMHAYITAHAASEPQVQVMDYDTVRRHLLDLVLVLPRDHWLLVARLREMSLKEAERMLRYCHSLLKMYGVAPSAQLPRPSNARVPSLSCVVDWTNALIDAHFAAFVLSPDTTALLKEVEESTKAEARLTKEMISLDGLLQHLVQRKPLPVRPIPKYTVDTLML